MTKEMKDVCKKFEEVIGWRIPVVERAGISVRSIAKAEPLHNNLLIQPWPISCWPAHRMGIYSNPLINGLIQHTFKINFVFVEKFSVIP